MHDNTGGYHLAYSTGVQAFQIDFSDPQGGKGAAEQICGNL